MVFFMSKADPTASCLEPGLIWVSLLVWQENLEGHKIIAPPVTVVAEILISQSE